MNSAELAELDALLSDDWISLADFIEATIPITLDPWQVHLCERLQALRWQTGQRLLVHAPPQSGKSIVVSQRLPAWYLAYKRTARVKLACYNVTHATKFGRVLRDLMQSVEYRQLFPSAQLRLPSVVSAEEWTLPARREIGDAQASFQALGLLTGFVGQGADLLIIDDPYASPQDAASPAIRESVWTFWDESARVRINDDTNVAVMFHRYHEDDLAGRLLSQGGWELLRYAAIADGDYMGFSDPLGRPEGERLSPRMSDEFLEEQQTSNYAWQGQFQGRPYARGGGMFPREKFGVPLPAAPAQAKRIRYWDKAGADIGKGDFTVGVLMAKTPDGRFFVEDVRRFQKTANERNTIIVQTAHSDRERYGGIEIYVEQPPGLGKESTDTIIKLLAGFTAYADPVRGEKTERAEPFAAQVQAGNVGIVSAAWNEAYLSELEAFPGGKNDDQVDGSSGAFNMLTSKRQIRFYGDDD